MSASNLRREIEMPLGLSRRRAASLRQAAAQSTPARPRRPCRTPNPNIASLPNTRQGAGDRFNGHVW